VLIRELAAELDDYPATTGPVDVERHRKQSREADARREA